MRYIEIREALSLRGEPRRWFVTENGVSVGGEVGTDGAGDLLFGSPEEAEAWALDRYFGGVSKSAYGFEYERLDGVTVQA
jgi:hypothetical protein